MYYVYILYSRTKDRYYVGYTHNIEIRLSKHNAGATPSTRGGRPWELVYSEEYIDKSSALFREREIKSKKIFFDFISRSRNNAELLSIYSSE